MLVLPGSMLRFNFIGILFPFELRSLKRRVRKRMVQFFGLGQIADEFGSVGSIHCYVDVVHFTFTRTSYHHFHFARTCTRRYEARGEASIALAVISSIAKKR